VKTVAQEQESRGQQIVAQSTGLNTNTQVTGATPEYAQAAT